MAAPTKLGNWQEALDSLLQKHGHSSFFQTFKSCHSNTDRIKCIVESGALLDVEWLMMYFKECCPRFHRKSDEKSAHYRDLGNKLFQVRKYEQALASYTQSVQFASCCHGDSNEYLALAYGNRSATLYHMNKYKECIADIERAQQAGFPLKSRHKLHSRRCLSYVKLGRKHDATQELAVIYQLKDKAEQNGESAAETLARDIILIEKEISKLTKGEKTFDQVADADTFPLPEVSHGKNSVLVQASAAIEMKTSTAQGRYLQARQPITAGDTLIVERPFAAVLLPDHYTTHCHQCFGVLPFNPVGCVRCSRVLYCDEDCRDRAWAAYHHVECPYLDLLHSVGIAHLSLRIVLTAGLQFLQDFLQSDDRTQRSVPGLTREGRYERNYLSVFDLVTHASDMQAEDLFQYSLTATLLLAILVHSGWVHIGAENVSDAPTVDSFREEWDAKYARLETFLKAFHAKEEKSSKADNCGDTPGCREPEAGCRKVVDETEEQEPALERSDPTDSRTGDSQSSVTKTPEIGSSRKGGTDTVFAIGGVLLRHVQQLVCNAHAITALQVTQMADGSAVDTQSQVRVATAIYPTASLMNHSCNPTIISSFIKDVLVVKSVKDVATGGEIFNCYGPHWKRMKRNERQETLKSQYFFDCHCEACLRMDADLSLCESLRCSNCGKSLPVQQDVPTQCPKCHREFNVQAILPKLQKADKHFAEGIEKLETGNLEGALLSLHSCLRIREELMAPDHHEFGQIHDALAQCLAMMGRYSEAVGHLSSSLRVTEAVYGAHSVETTRELHKMAEVQVNAGHVKEALEMASRAVKLAKMHCAESDSWVQELLCLQTALTRIVEDSAPLT